VGHSRLVQVVTNLQCILFCVCDSVLTEMVPEFVQPVAHSYLSFLMLISLSSILYSYTIECLTSQQCWVYCRICMYDCLTGISSGLKFGDYVCNVNARALTVW
jgi:hypothetical protein